METFFVRRCDNCIGYADRTFTDSWTGKELCLDCLAPIAMKITMSPDEDGGDNLPELLEAV